MLDRRKSIALKKLYYDESSTSLLGSQGELYRAAKIHHAGLSISLADVRKFLQEQKVYALHKPSRHKFPRLKTTCLYIGMLHQADLADFQKHRKNNDGFRYILVVVDCASRFAWAQPLKSKENKYIVQAFKAIYDKLKYKPDFLQTDDGKEFIGTLSQRYFSENGIRFYTTKSVQKAALAERFIRSLKTKLFKYFTQHNSRRWLEILPVLMKAYNSQVHSATGKAPKDVTFSNQAAIYKRKLLPFKRLPKPKFRIGQKVRIPVKKSIFSKGYEANYTEKSYLVTSINFYGTIVTYRLQDSKRRYYEYELIAVHDE
jgi:hypothetical protein